MDTVTHTLFGMTLYGSIEKKDMDKPTQRSLILATFVGSQIPDIDVISKIWDKEGLYQMWHRGITHSLFLVPFWALLLTLLCKIFFKVPNIKKVYIISFLAVFIHSTSDLFNAWGTGYFEPISQIRITFGTIPIIDFVYWFFMISAMIITRFLKYKKHRVFQLAWGLMVCHLLIQSIGGYSIYKKYETNYEQIALSASFIPWHYSVIGKNENVVEISETAIFGELEQQHTLYSYENADLNRLFSERPEAKTLYEWSPFVVVVDDGERLGLYDPRFYRNGQSFLFEYIEKR